MNQFYMKREIYLNLSGNEVYYRNSLILPVKNMLCSELHRQKGFNLILFSYMSGRPHKRIRRTRGDSTCRCLQGYLTREKEAHP